MACGVIRAMEAMWAMEESARRYSPSGRTGAGLCARAASFDKRRNSPRSRSVSLAITLFEFLDFGFQTEETEIVLY